MYNWQYKSQECMTDFLFKNLSHKDVVIKVEQLPMTGYIMVTCLDQSGNSVAQNPVLVNGNSF